jgi:hypothetical protein
LPVYRPRTRLVNFRLSEDEYQMLKDTCARSGARSVSDYARSAVLSGNGIAMTTLDEPTDCIDRWERLEGIVCQLEAKMSRLMDKEMVASHG